MRSRKTVFIIIIIYNLIGLISLLGLQPKDPFYWDWSVLFLIFTFPITIISFGYRFFQAEPIYPIFIIQVIVLFISLYVTNLIMKYKRK
jgi:hypothetical protein